MRHIHEVFEDKDFEKLEILKGDLGWREFIMLMYDHCYKLYKRGAFKIFIKPRNCDVCNKPATRFASPARNPDEPALCEEHFAKYKEDFEKEIVR